MIKAFDFILPPFKYLFQQKNFVRRNSPLTYYHETERNEIAARHANVIPHMQYLIKSEKRNTSISDLRGKIGYLTRKKDAHGYFTMRTT